MAEKFIAIAMPGGYAVAYHSALGGLTSVTECATREAAELQAAYRNAQHQAEIRAQHASLARHREHAMKPRRPVRWFEPDQFA